MVGKNTETITVQNVEPHPAINHNWLESYFRPLIEGVEVSEPDSEEKMKISNFTANQRRFIATKIEGSGMKILEN